MADIHLPWCPTNPTQLHAGEPVRVTRGDTTVHAPFIAMNDDIAVILDLMPGGTSFYLDEGWSFEAHRQEVEA